jgi:hypothetical protein
MSCPPEGPKEACKEAFLLICEKDDEPLFWSLFNPYHGSQWLGWRADDIRRSRMPSRPCSAPRRSSLPY